MIFIPLFVFVFGLIIGSFLNVVILRLNTGRSIVHGGSRCARCDKALRWYELVPVFSFLALRGRCARCKQAISFQYPIVELVTAISFVVLFSRFVLPAFFSITAWFAFAWMLAVASLLIVIFVYDLRHKIIPDMAVYPLIVLGVIGILWKWAMVSGYLPGTALVGGVLVALPFFCLWFFSKGRLLGFGDVKLALALAWILGVQYSISSFVLSFWIGGIVGLFLIALSHKYRMKSEIPFAPFLIAGAAVAVIGGITTAALFPFLS
jgi:prepilin signal peptidase PulO-like enzyme (type II secretory pathway)